MRSVLFRCSHAIQVTHLLIRGSVVVEAAEPWLRRPLKMTRAVSLRFVAVRQGGLVLVAGLALVRVLVLVTLVAALLATEMEGNPVSSNS